MAKPATNAEHLPHGPLVTASGGSQQIPLSQIDCDWKYNISRQFVNAEHMKRSLEEMKNSESFKELVSSLRHKAQINEVTIKPHPVKGGKPYRLVAGFRRCMAAEVLGWEKIRASITAADEVTADQINLVENKVRENLSRFQLASAALKYQKDHNVPSEELGKVFGFSAPYMRGLVDARERLHPELLVAWADRDEEKDPAVYSATAWDRIQVYKSLPAAQQLGEYKVQVVMNRDGITQEEAEKKVKAEGFKLDDGVAAKAKRGAKTVTKMLKKDTVKVVHKAVLDELKGDRHPPQDKALFEAVSAALGFVLQKPGFKKAIKVGKVVIYDPAAEEEEETEESDD